MASEQAPHRLLTAKTRLGTSIFANGLSGAGSAGFGKHTVASLRQPCQDAYRWYQMATRIMHPVTHKQDCTYTRLSQDQETHELAYMYAMHAPGLTTLAAVPWHQLLHCHCGVGFHFDGGLIIPF